MQIDDVLEWARDGKWHILETHPQVIAEAFEQLADLRVSASRPTQRAGDNCPDCGGSGFMVKIDNRKVSCVYCDGTGNCA